MVFVCGFNKKIHDPLHYIFSFGLSLLIVLFDLGVSSSKHSYLLFLWFNTFVMHFGGRRNVENNREHEKSDIVCKRVVIIDRGEFFVCFKIQTRHQNSYTDTKIIEIEFCFFLLFAAVVNSCCFFNVKFIVKNFGIVKICYWSLFCG